MASSFKQGQRCQHSAHSALPRRTRYGIRSWRAGPRPISPLNSCWSSPLPLPRAAPQAAAPRRATPPLLQHHIAQRVSTRNVNLRNFDCKNDMLPFPLRTTTGNESCRNVAGDELCCNDFLDVFAKDVVGCVAIPAALKKEFKDIPGKWRCGSQATS